MSRGQAKRSASGGKVIDPDLVAKAIGKGVYDGDIVNFRLLFSPFSPARLDSPECFETEKYAYLLPGEEMEETEAFQQVLSRVREPRIWSHIQAELAANRPAQLPWELVLALADQAVRAGKYTSAAQAYEMLRIRRPIQEEFFKQAEVALEEGKVDRAVYGFLIATGLEYNYAAFPEPLPAVPDFQTRALILHGEYPERPESSLPMAEPEAFLRTALTYLLSSPEAAARLDRFSFGVRVAFLKALVHQGDPRWEEFVRRYHLAVSRLRELEGRLARTQFGGSFAEEVEDTLVVDLMELPILLVGRKIQDGEWWQYLKELAYEHPAAALFVSRFMLSDKETLVPRYRHDSPIPREMSLVPEAEG